MVVWGWSAGLIRLDNPQTEEGREDTDALTKNQKSKEDWVARGQGGAGRWQMGSFETYIIYLYCMYPAPWKVGGGGAGAQDTDLRTICYKW